MNWLFVLAWGFCAIALVPRVGSAQSAAPVATAASDPQAVAIVEAYLKGIGGREVLSKVQDRVTSFRNVKYQSTGETVAEISLYMKNQHMLREEWDIKGFDIKGKPLAFVQIYNGETEEAWVQMLGTVSPLEGKTLNVFVWDKHMTDFFYDWEGAGYRLNVIGQGLVEENPCDIVEVVDFSGRQRMRYFFARQGGLLLKKEWLDDTASPGNPVKREQYYKKYRALPFLDGSGLSVKFPLLLEIFADGDLDTERQYTNVRFNSKLSDKLFTRPEGQSFKDFQAQREAEQAAKKQAEPDATQGGKKPPQGSAPKKKQGSAPKRKKAPEPPKGVE
jgi:hypothetical protein